MTDDDHRCELLRNDAGEVIARIRVSPDLDERGRAALTALVAAAARKFEEDCAADPTIGERQAAAVERIHARVRRLRGEAP